MVRLLYSILIPGTSREKGCAAVAILRVDIGVSTKKLFDLSLIPIRCRLEECRIVVRLRLFFPEGTKRTHAYMVWLVHMYLYFYFTLVIGPYAIIGVEY